MDKVTVVNCCLGVLGLLLQQGVIGVEARSMFNSENHVFNPSNDAGVQNKILALLLHNSLVPAEKDNPLGAELANKIAELEELRVLREDVERESKITASLSEDKFINRKRNEPCFWKYCV